MAQLSRRDFLRAAGALAAATALGGCQAQAGAGRTIKIGYVSPQSGPLAGFGEADAFILGEIRARLASGLKIGAATYPVEILVKDSQSDPNRAADLASTLILTDKIDLMVVASTPETTNPVADKCESNKIPCISTMAPWQPWYFRNPQVAAGGYEWTYHYFWGLEDIIAVFASHWDSIETNRVVGALWPNDGDGQAWSDPQNGFPPALKAKGFTLIDPGRYENLAPDFSSQIAAFKAAGVEIVTGVMLPPDVQTFLAQAAAQGFAPKAVTVAKGALLPSMVGAIKDNLSQGLTTEVWWSPQHPYASSLTGASAAKLAETYQSSTGKQWTQPLGYIHSLFEVALDVLGRTANIDDKAAILAAIKSTNLNTIIGPVAWGKGPVPNVAKTPLVGGQWVKGATFPWDLVITVNAGAPAIPTAGTTQVRP